MGGSAEYGLGGPAPAYHTDALNPLLRLRGRSTPMPVINLRLMQEIWHENPPALVILFGIVLFVVGYAWTWWPGGVVLLALGIALSLGGCGSEIVWLCEKRKKVRQS